MYGNCVVILLRGFHSVGAGGKHATIVNMVWVACEQDGHYMVVTDRWQRFSDLVVNEATLAMLSASADEFLVHGVDVEGKRLTSANI